MSSTLNGAKLLVQTLKDFDVKYVFGIPGGQNLPLYDALYDEQASIRHIAVRDERNAVYIADAYARVSYKPGICDCNSGPGATNALTGVAESLYHSIPIIVITAAVDDAYVGKGATQELDHVPLFRPLTKWSVHIGKANRIPEIVCKAFRIATSGRPGPVHIDIPVNVFVEKIFNVSLNPVDKRYCTYPSYRFYPEDKLVEQAALLWRSAERPVVIAGGGVLKSQAWRELLKLAEFSTAPVATTVGGKGSISENHHLSVGVVGKRPRPCANRVVEQADVILAVGCKFSMEETSNWTVPRIGTKIIQVDVDPAEIGKIYPVKVGIIGDAKVTLEQFLLMLASHGQHQRIRTPWIDNVQTLVKEWRDSLIPEFHSGSTHIRVQDIIKALRENLDKNDVLVVDTSLSRTFGPIYYDVFEAGRTFLNPAGQGPMGWGFPAA